MNMTENFEKNFADKLEAVAKEVLKEKYKNTDFKDSAVYFANKASAEADKNRYFSYKINANNDSEFVIDTLLSEALCTKLNTVRKTNNGKILQDAARIFLFTTSASKSAVEEVICSGLLKYTFTAAKKIVDADNSINVNDRPYCYRSLAMTIGEAFNNVLPLYQADNKNRWVNVVVRSEFLDLLTLHTLDGVEASGEDLVDIEARPLPDDMKDVAACFKDVVKNQFSFAAKKFTDNQKFYNAFCEGGCDLYEVDFLVDICEHLYEILKGCNFMLDEGLLSPLQNDEKAAVNQIIEREFEIEANDLEKGVKVAKAKENIKDIVKAYLNRNRLMEFRKASIVNYPSNNEPMDKTAWVETEVFYVKANELDNFALAKKQDSYFTRRNAFKLTEYNFFSNYTNKGKDENSKLSDELLTFQRHVRARTIIHETTHMVKNWEDHAYAGGYTFEFDSDDSSNNVLESTIFYFSNHCYKNGRAAPSKRKLDGIGKVNNLKKPINTDTYVKLMNSLYFMYAKRSANVKFIKDIFQSREKLTEYLVLRLYLAIKKGEEFYYPEPIPKNYIPNNFPKFIEGMERDMWWKYWVKDFNTLHKDKTINDLASTLNNRVTDKTFKFLDMLFSIQVGQLNIVKHSYLGSYFNGLVAYWNHKTFPVISYHGASGSELLDLSKTVEEINAAASSSEVDSGFGSLDAEDHLTS